MITINLLSSKEKKDISFEKTNISLIGSFIMLFGILIILSIALYSIQDLQKENLNTLGQQTKSVKAFLDQEDNKKVEEKVEKINSYLATIKKIQENKTSFSKTLIQISEITPNGIRLYNIDLKKSEKTFEISGNANSRDNLLKMQDNLEKSDYFENIESPISNLISPSDINFSLAGNLTDKALKND